MIISRKVRVDGEEVLKKWGFAYEWLAREAPMTSAYLLSSASRLGSCHGGTHRQQQRGGSQQCRTGGPRRR